jgi:flagellum-specific peptidoglycan hydrolase FlgJ
MYGNNFGGIKAGARGPSALLETTEGYGSQARRVRDRFRTYATPEEGARDYVSLLARRYPEAFRALQAGDVEGFAAGLHQGRYFTANPETYRAALRRLAEEHRLGPSSAPPAGPVELLALDGLRWALEKARED